MKLWINNPTCCSPEDKTHTISFLPHKKRTKKSSSTLPETDGCGVLYMSALTTFGPNCPQLPAQGSEVCAHTHARTHTHIASSSLLRTRSLSVYLFQPIYSLFSPSIPSLQKVSLININVSSHAAGQGLLTAKWSSHRIMKPLGSRWEDRGRLM